MNMFSRLLVFRIDYNIYIYVMYIDIYIYMCIDIMYISIGTGHW